MEPEEVESALLKFTQPRVLERSPKKASSGFGRRSSLVERREVRFHHLGLFGFCFAFLLQPISYVVRMSLAQTLGNGNPTLRRLKVEL